MKASDLGCLWVVVGPAAAVLLVFGVAIAAGIAATVIALLLVAALAAGVALIPPILGGLTLIGVTVALRHSVRGGSHGWAAVEFTARQLLAAARDSLPMLRPVRGGEVPTLESQTVPRPIPVLPRIASAVVRP